MSPTAPLAARLKTLSLSVTPPLRDDLASSARRRRLTVGQEVVRRCRVEAPLPVVTSSLAGRRTAGEPRLHLDVQIPIDLLDGIHAAARKRGTTLASEVVRRCEALAESETIRMLAARADARKHQEDGEGLMKSGKTTPADTPDVDHARRVLREQLRAVFAEEGPFGRFLSAPTGSGKTHSACAEAADLLLRDEEARVAVVAPQTFNASEAYQKLCSFLGDRAECAYLVRSNIGSIADARVMAALASVPLSTNLSGPARALVNRIRAWQISSSPGFYDPDGLIATDMRESLRREEANFRRAVGRALRSAARERKCLPRELLDEAEWAWVREAFPQVDTLNKRAYVMTPEKFLMPHDTIVNGIIHFTDGIFRPGDLVVVDESDEVWDLVLRRLVDESARRRVDVPEMCARLARDLCPVDLLIDNSSLLSPKEAVRRGDAEEVRRLAEGLAAEEDRDREDTIAVMLRHGEAPARRTGLSQACDELHHVYVRENLRFHHKLEDAPSRRFMFSGYGPELISCGRAGGGMVIVSDAGNRLNVIKRRSARGDDAGRARSVGVMVRSCDRAIERVAKAIYVIAQQRCQAVADGDELSVEHHVRSVINCLRLSEEDSRLLFDVTMSLPASSLATRPRSANAEWLRRDCDESVYAQGVRLYKFEDSPDHDTYTSVMSLALRTTPEALLASLCSQTRVVLMSATAELDGALNYALRFMEGRSGGRVARLPDHERARVRRASELDIERRRQAYEVRAAVSAARTLDDVLPGCTGLAALGAQKTLANLRDDRRDLFLFVVDCFAAFLRQGYAEAGLCFINARLSEDAASGYSEASVRSLLTFVADEVIRLDPSARKARAVAEDPELVMFAVARTWDATIRSAHARLAAGRPVFVITLYRSAFIGKNIQYVPASAADWVSVGGGEDLKDFDFLALSCPTHIFESSATDDGSALRLAYEQLLLVERGERSAADGIRQTKAGLGGAYPARHGEEAENQQNAKIKDLPSYGVALTRYVTQAVGRITRARLKARVVTIMMQRELAALVDAAATDSIPVTYEVDRTMAAARAYQLKARPDVAPRHEADRVLALSDSRRRDQRARHVRMVRTSKETVAQHVAERTWLLPNPTMPEMPPVPDDRLAQSAGYLARFTYAELPSPAASYAYVADAATDEILGFAREDSGLPSRGVVEREVSSASTRLDDLMAVPLVRRWFEDHGWATSWRPARYIMLPCVANDVYKGALGEQALAAFYEGLRGGSLQIPPLDDLSDDLARFELFDFRVEGTDLYLDAKHYGQTFDHEGEACDAMLEKVWGKMEDVGATTALVVNDLFVRPGARPVTRTKPGPDGRTMRLVTIPGLFLEGRPVVETASRFVREVAAACGR